MPPSNIIHITKLLHLILFLAAAITCQELPNVYVVDNYFVDLHAQPDSCDIFVTERITYTLFRGNFSTIERDITLQWGSVDSIDILLSFPDSEPSDQVPVNYTSSTVDDPDGMGGNMYCVVFGPLEGPDGETLAAPGQIIVTISFWWRGGMVEINYKNLVAYPGGEDGWENIDPASYNMNILLPYEDLQSDQITFWSGMIFSVEPYANSPSSLYVMTDAEMEGEPTFQFPKRVKDCKIQFTSLDLTDLVLAIVLPIGSVILCISALIAKCCWGRIQRRRFAARVLREELQMRQIGVQKEPTPQSTPQTGFAMA